jgi:beta-N-acetylhexosaminidase
MGWAVSLSAREVRPPRAVVLGCHGTVLGDEERRFFGEADPLGFILFRRNCETPDQVRALVASLRGTVGRDDAPVFIDQEGGRVARLEPPHWRAPPPAALFGVFATEDPEAASEAVRLNARLIAAELTDLGISIDCVPVLDVPVEGASDVIGDRAFGADPSLVARLGRDVSEAMIESGVLPVIKHMPGHGRALLDSHHELPRVEAPLELLRETDFAPFRALADAPWGMTAHVIYSAVDDKAATVSSRVVEEVIRGDIGFQGVLFSDDLSMNALGGSLGERAVASLAAGCDVVEHCNGKLDEMREVVAAVGPLDDAALARLAAAEARRGAPEPFDRGAALARLATLLPAA